MSLYLRAVWRSKALILLSALIGGAAGMLVSALRPPDYSATAMVRITEPTVTPLAEAVATLQDVDAIRTAAARTPYPAPPPDGFLRNHLMIQPVPGASLLRVTVTFPDASWASAMAVALVEEAVRIEDARRISAAAGQLEVLQQRLHKASVRLHELERARAAPHGADAGEGRLSRDLEYQAYERVYLRYAQDAARAQLLQAGTDQPHLRVAAMLPPARTSPSAVRMFLFSMLAALAASTLLVCAAAFARSTSGSAP